MRTKFWPENGKGKDQLEDVGIDMRITLELALIEIVLEDVDWIHLAQDRDQGRAVVNTVMKLRVP
jgi:hypothetical protein